MVASTTLTSLLANCRQSSSAYCQTPPMGSAVIKIGRAGCQSATPRILSLIGDIFAVDYVDHFSHCVGPFDARVIGGGAAQALPPSHRGPPPPLGRGVVEKHPAGPPQF